MSPVLPANATAAVVAQGAAAGYTVVLLDVTAACGDARTGCTDGCAHHPGQAGHRAMAALAVPVVQAAMGWAPV